MTGMTRRRMVDRKIGSFWLECGSPQHLGGWRRDSGRPDPPRGIVPGRKETAAWTIPNCSPSSWASPPPGT